MVHRTWVALLALLAAGAAAGEPPAPAGDGPAAPSLTEINKKLANPVSDLWSISLQQNNFQLDLGPGIGERWSSNLNFQPVLPVALTDDWNLITRPVMKLLPDGWSIGYSGNVLANWEEDEYMPIRPDVFGQKWNAQVLLVPVIPKLVRGNLTKPGELRFGLGG